MCQKILLIACGTFPSDFAAPYAARALELYHAHQSDELEILLPGALWRDGTAHPCYRVGSYADYSAVTAPLLAGSDMAIVLFRPSNARQCRCLQVLCDLAYSLRKPLYPQVITLLSR